MLVTHTECLLISRNQGGTADILRPSLYEGRSFFGIIEKMLYCRHKTGGKEENHERNAAENQRRSDEADSGF